MQVLKFLKFIFNLWFFFLLVFSLKKKFDLFVFKNKILFL